jgi:hypothetical protein
MEKSIKQLLNYFNVKNAGDIVWSHAVNSEEKLSKCLADNKLMIIESDIRISDEGKVIAAHPPVKTSDLYFDDLIKKVAGKKKGIKLDFKDPEVLEYCLKHLKSNPLDEPVILNADILQGNKAGEPKIKANDFINICSEYYPQGFLSLGWTTVADFNSPYTKENIKEMIELCRNLKQDILLPLRACLLPNSWKNLKEILNNENYWASLWNNEPINDTLLNWMKANTDYQKTFYDFIENGESIKLI